MYAGDYFEPLSSACAVLSKLFLRTIENAEKCFNHLKNVMVDNQNASTNLGEIVTSQASDVKQQSQGIVFCKHDDTNDDQDNFIYEDNEANEEYDSDSVNQTSANESSMNDETENLKKKSVYLTLTDGTKHLMPYLIKKRLMETAIVNKRKKFSVRRTYVCIKCPYKDRNFSIFSKHLIGHVQQSDSSKCRYCDFYEISRTKLVNHEKLHPECDTHQMFDSSQRKSKSMIKQRKKEKASSNSSIQKIVLEDSDGSRYETTYSLVKSTCGTSKYNLYNKNSVRRLYVCTQCPFNGRVFSLFKEHLLKHKYRGDAFQCRQCSFCETSRVKIMHHEKLHLNKAIQELNASSGPVTRNSK